MLPKPLTEFTIGATAGVKGAAVERNIGAWGYVYQKFREDEDEILDILICLQRLNKYIEHIFPEAKAFIRPGLDSD